MKTAGHKMKVQQISIMSSMSDIFQTMYNVQWGTAVAQWLRRCATNRKFTGSIPAGVSGFFIDIKSFRLHSASNRHEFQEYFLGVKVADA